MPSFLPSSGFGVPTSSYVVSVANHGLNYSQYPDTPDPTNAVPSLSMLPLLRQLLVVGLAAPRLAAAVGPHNCGADGLDPADRPTDCAWRQLAVEYAT